MKWALVKQSRSVSTALTHPLRDCCNVSLFVFVFFSDDCNVSTSGCDTVHLGATFDCCANINAVELGHGIQTVGARLQGCDVLWLSEGTQSKAIGTEELWFH